MSRESIRIDGASAQFDGRSFDLNEIVYQAARDFSRTRGSHIALALDTTAGLPRIKGDRDQLICVVYSLISRAADEGSQWIGVRTWMENERVRLSVSDETSKPAWPFIVEQCAGIVSEHQGEMFSWRTENGSVHTLQLPRCEADPTNSSKTVTLLQDSTCS